MPAIQKTLHHTLAALALLLPAAVVSAQIPANCQRISGEETPVAPDGYEADGTPVFCAKTAPAYGAGASAYPAATPTPGYGQQAYGQAAGGYGQTQGGYGQASQGAGGWSGGQSGGQQSGYGGAAGGGSGGAGNGYGGASAGYGSGAASGGFQGGTFGGRGSAQGGAGGGGSVNPYASGKAFTKRPKGGAQSAPAAPATDPYASSAGNGYGGADNGAAYGSSSYGHSNESNGYGGSGYGSADTGGSGPSSSQESNWPQTPAGPSSSTESAPAPAADTGYEPSTTDTPVTDPSSLQADPGRVRRAAVMPKPLAIPTTAARAGIKAARLPPSAAAVQTEPEASQAPVQKLPRIIQPQR